MRKLANFIANIPSLILGRFTWWSPPWLDYLNTQRKNSPKGFWFTCLILACFAGGYTYYNTLPQPDMVTVQIQSPPITSNVKNPQPSPLYVSFHLNGSTASVASLDSMDKQLNQSITITPSMAGSWKWQDESRLVFIPSNDWPAGQEYTLEFHKNLFSTSIKLGIFAIKFASFLISCSPPSV